MHDDPVRSASELARDGRALEAVTALEAAGVRGDPSAMAELAAWYLRGDLIPRDLSRARTALRRAVEIGHVDAALLEVALAANGTGASPDWARARRLLDRAAAGDPLAAEHAALLAAMGLDEDGYPVAPLHRETLSHHPFVARVAGALSPAECLHIAGVAHALLEPAVVVDPTTRRTIAHPVRSSYGAAIGPAHETLPIAALNRRLAAATHTALGHGEPLQVLRYTPGQEYKVHSDALPGVTNQRCVTAIAYLNDGFAGGQTMFPALDLCIQPRAGDVLVFHSISSDGRAIAEARHAGLPITAGTKWIATRWIRCAPYDPWTASSS